MNAHLRPLMLGGTGSDVGKSMLAAGLCRIFLQDGYRPAPFKSQNMALNSYVTPDGLEIGRAQAVQAEAAGVECMSEMNPVLLKPTGDMRAQVVLNGLPVGDKDAYSYFKKENKEPLRREACAAFDRLAARFNPIVMEGAGSVCELNLMDSDIVNMPMAEHAGAAVILVADIDRGGVFASVYGSIMLQPDNYRKLIKGIIINKFRGDVRLFRQGRDIMEKICGVPVLGVVPYMSDVHIEEEDSVSLIKKHRTHTEDNLINMAVVALPRMSNFTDFDTPARDPRIHLYFTDDPTEIRQADIIVLPGSKNTIGDLHAIESNGCAQAIVGAARDNRTIIGICGGYQMLGISVSDPDGVEGEPSEAQGLGLLPVNTVLTTRKTLKRVAFRTTDGDIAGDGYEIHAGYTRIINEAVPFAMKDDGGADGCRAGCVTGTYIHGVLDTPGVIDGFVLSVALAKGLPAESGIESYRVYKECQYDTLAARMREAIDMEKLYKILRDD